MNAPAESKTIEPVIGRYLHLDYGGRHYRIYFESAGRGIPLVCLHTAGSDTRQYRGLFNAASVTERFHVIAFDLPFHGKSSPPSGWQDEEYRLTADSYTGIIMAFIAALGLERPVVMFGKDRITRPHSVDRTGSGRCRPFRIAGRRSRRAGAASGCFAAHTAARPGPCLR